MDVFVRFVVPSHPRYLAVIRAAVGELGSVHGFPAADCRGIMLAVDEAVANVIRHAYHGDHNQVIEVNCRATEDRIEFTLLDQGDPPHPARLLPHPLDDVALSGRGIHIMRSIMDEVCYEQVPQGNQLRLSKRLPAPGSVAGEEPDRI